MCCRPNRDDETRRSERKFMPRANSNADTSQRILDIAERLLQTRGYNAFSYADIAKSLHITKASLHYHFPTKAELGKRLIERYGRVFLQALGDIDRTSAAADERLRHYVGLYEKVLRNDRMCLCGMLAAEYETLPKPMKAELKHFFDENERWLIATLTAGQGAGKIGFSGSAKEMARLLVGSLEGAMMLARSYGDVRRFETAAQHLLAGLGVKAPSPAAPENRNGFPQTARRAG
jgi:TetR/AcrR family transcriptional regulator, transcriptional repressor for nem operon